MLYRDFIHSLPHFQPIYCPLFCKQVKCIQCHNHLEHWCKATVQAPAFMTADGPCRPSLLSPLYESNIGGIQEKPSLSKGDQNLYHYMQPTCIVLFDKHNFEWEKKSYDRRHKTSWQDRCNKQWEEKHAASVHMTPTGSWRYLLNVSDWWQKLVFMLVLAQSTTFRQKYFSQQLDGPTVFSNVLNVQEAIDNSMGFNMVVCKLFLCYEFP